MKNIRIYFKLTFVCVIFVLCASCTNTCHSGKVVLKLTNTSGFDRENDMVEIPLNQIVGKLSLDSSKVILVKDSRDSVIASQVTYDSLLIFQISLKSGKKKMLSVVSGCPTFPKFKVFGVYYKEHNDDFIWENDMVGFRFYGSGLQPYQGANNALDIWMKRTHKLVLQDWYYKDKVEKISFHEDHGEGCDPYWVHRSLGAGAMAPLIKDSAVLNGNFISNEILDNGPLRFTAKLVYPTFEVNGDSVSEVRTVSIDAGDRLTKITEDFGNVSFPVVVGIIKRNNGLDSILSDTKQGYMIYQEPIEDPNGQLFMGAYVPQGLLRVFVNTCSRTNTASHETADVTSVLGQTNYDGQPISYYAGFGWNKFNIKDVDDFKTYMQSFIQRKQYPIEVKIK